MHTCMQKKREGEEKKNTSGQDFVSRIGILVLLIRLQQHVNWNVRDEKMPFTQGAR